MRWTTFCAFILCGALASSAFAADRQHRSNHVTQPLKKDDERKRNKQNNPGNQVQNPNGIDSNANGTPKTNDGVSGGNSTNSGQTQRSVPGANPNMTNTNTNTNGLSTSTSTTPTAPAGALYDPKAPRTAGPDSDKGTKVTPGDFSRDKQLKDLTDTGVDKVKGEGGKGGSTGPISDNPANPLTSATATGAVPRPGSGTGDKRGEQGMFANTSGLGGSGGSDPTKTPTGSAPAPIPYPQASSAPPAEKTPPPATPAASNGDNAGTAGGVASGTNMGSTKSTVSGFSSPVEGGVPASRLTSVTASPGTASAPSSVKTILLGGTPDPDKDTGDGKGVPASLRGQGPAKTPAQVEAERKRQVGLPNESGAPPDKMYMENAAKENLTARQSNLINPQQGDGTTSNLGVGVAPPPQGTGSNPTGGKAGGGQGSGVPGQKPDDPSASNACGAGNNC